MAKKSRQKLAAERTKRLRAESEVKVAAFAEGLAALMLEHGVRVNCDAALASYFDFIDCEYGILLIDEDLNSEGVEDE